MTTPEERALHMANENRGQWTKDQPTIDELIDRVAVAAFSAGCEHGKCAFKEVVKKTFNPNFKNEWP